MTKDLPVVYVAGPFRGKTAWRIEENIRRVERLGLLVASLGAIPLIPHTMYRFFDGEKSDHFWLVATQKLLRRCDAVIFSENWESSVGSLGEHELAQQINLPIFYVNKGGLNELSIWLEEPWELK